MREFLVGCAGCCCIYYRRCFADSIIYDDFMSTWVFCCECIASIVKMKHETTYEELNLCYSFVDLSIFSLSEMRIPTAL